MNSDSTPSPLEGQSLTSLDQASTSEVNIALGAAWKKLEEVTEILTSLRSKEAEVTTAQASLMARITEGEGKLQEIANMATVALAAKTQIVDIQTVVATKSDHIEDAQKHADGVRADMDRALTAIMKSATEAEGNSDEVKSAADSSAQLLLQLLAAKEKAESDLATIVKDQEAAHTAAIATKGLADKSASIEQRVAGYERNLSELRAQCIAQLETITVTIR